MDYHRTVKTNGQVFGGNIPLTPFMTGMFLLGLLLQGDVERTKDSIGILGVPSVVLLIVISSNERKSVNKCSKEI